MKIQLKFDLKQEIKYHQVTEKKESKLKIGCNVYTSSTMISVDNKESIQRVHVSQNIGFTMVAAASFVRFSF